LRQQANRGDYEAQLKLAGVLAPMAREEEGRSLAVADDRATCWRPPTNRNVKGERDALGRDMKPKRDLSCRRAAKWLDGFKASQLVQAAPRAPSSPSVFQVGNGVESPQLIRQVRPAYTENAKRKKIEGVVVLQAVVLVDGTVGQVKVLRSLDPTYGLDQEALKAASQWRFVPGTRSGVPVAVQITIELTFTLK
jgi:TonB family protein